MDLKLPGHLSGGYLATKRLVFLLALALIGFMMLTACGNNKKANEADISDPVYESDPGVKSLTEQIKNTPENAGLFFERGKKLHKLQYDSLALRDFKTATTLDSNKAEYYSAIGDLLFENKDLAGSVIWIQKALAKNPEDKNARLKIAKLFLYLQDYQKSFAEINKVLRKNPYDPEAYFLKGMIYKDLRDTAKAISSFQTVIQVAPEYRPAILQMGLLYSAKQDPIALRYLDNAYKMDSNDVFPVFARGVFYQQNNDYVNAKAEYKKCILRNRHYVDAYFNMGYILLQQDSLEKAYRQFDLAAKIDPRNPTIYYNRGLCSEMMDSTKKAIDDYRLAASIDTSYPSPKEALKRLKVKENK